MQNRSFINAVKKNDGCFRQNEGIRLMDSENLKPKSLFGGNRKAGPKKRKATIERFCISEMEKLGLIKSDKKEFRKIEFCEPMAVKEVIQAGDVFLIRFRCEVCRAISISSLNDISCASCQTEWPNRGVTDPGRLNFRCLAGTARKKGVISVKIVRRLMEIQQGDCAYCFSKLEKYHIEHIIPISFGGTNNFNNLVLSCPRCNQVAGSSVFPTMEAKRAYIQRRRFRFGVA